MHLDITICESISIPHTRPSFVCDQEKPQPDLEDLATINK